MSEHYAEDQVNPSRSSVQLHKNDSYTPVTVATQVVLLSLFTSWVTAATFGTAFTYQGELIRNGVPANGSYDLVFEFYDGSDPTTAILIGEASANGVAVNDGVFMVKLDPGSNLFTGQSVWTQIRVKPSGPGPFTDLSPTQEITPTPYAQFCSAAGVANSIASGGSFAGNISVNGSLTAASGTFRVVQGDTFIDAPAGVPPRVSLRPFESRENNQDLWEIAVDVVNPSINGGRPLVFANGDSGSTGMLLAPGGDVGIGGYFAPEARLDVRGGGIGIEAGDDRRAEVALSDATGTHWRFYVDPNGAHGTVLEADGSPRPALSTLPDGTVGIGTSSPDPSYSLDVASGGLRITSSSGSGSDASLTLQSSQASTSNWKLAIDENNSGLFYMRYGTANSNVFSITPQGTATVNVLEIKGADLAERFPFSEPAEPGMVAAIDPVHTGQLVVARGAYNHRVAGIVAGAKDFKTGVVLGTAAEPDDHVYPVALSGRVWVRAEASGGAIEPGSFLTTSDLPGFAMNASEHPRSNGAILGKAMSGLSTGQGMVLVLVNLQ